MLLDSSIRLAYEKENAWFNEFLGVYMMTNEVRNTKDIIFFNFCSDEEAIYQLGISHMQRSSNIMQTSVNPTYNT